MLRLTVLILMLANGVWWAWAQDWLRPWGFGPSSQAEPQRLQQQVQPQALRVLQGDAAQRLAEAPAGSSLPTCLVTAPLPEPVLAALRAPLAAWPAASWRLEPAIEPARWIIYMGKYPDAQGVERKKAELRRRGVSFEPLSNPSLEPGLSLGGFGSQAAANDRLIELAALDVRSARVVQERPELRGTALRLPVVDEPLRARLDELRGALGGQPLLACR